MPSLPIKVNDICEIVVEKEVFKSNIQDITEEYIAISLPVANGSYASLTRNDNIEVIFYYEQNVYAFFAKVIGRKKENNIRMIMLSIPDENDIRKIQRRKNFRIELFQEVKYKVIQESSLNQLFIDNAIKHLDEFFKAIMMDLSGGGARILIEEKISEGQCALIYLPLKDKEIIVSAICIRCIKNNTGNYLCGFKFKDISSRQREDIISYTFDIMRERMKKR